MDLNELKNNLKKLANREFYKYYAATGVLVAMVLMLFFGMGQRKTDEALSVEPDPNAGAYEQYVESKDEALNNLIQTYYTAYTAGDTDTLWTVAMPISDSEVSYIKFYSQYIESYTAKSVRYKPGVNEGEYLVSVEMEIKYNGIDTPAPGLDFFYVCSNEDGTYYINNLYSSYNMGTNENAMDPSVVSLITTLEQQDDLNALMVDVEERFNTAVASDENLSTFYNNTLPAETKSWSENYTAATEAATQAQADAEAAAAEEAAQAEAEAAAAEAAEAEANGGTTTVVTTDTVNVRDSASESGERLGQVAVGTTLTKYAEEGEWSKVDYNGQPGYIKTEFLADSAENNTDDSSESTASSDGNSPAQGERVTLSSTVNVRSGMGEQYSKVAVAYAGEYVDVIMSYADGWTKVKYNGKEGYIKTEFLK